MGWGGLQLLQLLLLPGPRVCGDTLGKSVVAGLPRGDVAEALVQQELAVAAACKQLLLVVQLLQLLPFDEQLHFLMAVEAAAWMVWLVVGLAAMGGPAGPPGWVFGLIAR